eukprot:6201604-Pleurochrysis_carterae.AAC.2
MSIVRSIARTGARSSAALRHSVRPVCTAVTSGKTGVFPDAPSPMQVCCTYFLAHALDAFVILVEFGPTTRFGLSRGRQSWLAASLHVVAPRGCEEFSVVYTDRALNHMSEPFKKVRFGSFSHQHHIAHAARA